VLGSTGSLYPLDLSLVMVLKQWGLGIIKIYNRSDILYNVSDFEKCSTKTPAQLMNFFCWFDDAMVG
jgi:hypothetical protein